VTLRTKDPLRLGRFLPRRREIPREKEVPPREVLPMGREMSPVPPLGGPMAAIGRFSALIRRMSAPIRRLSTLLRGCFLSLAWGAPVAGARKKRGGIGPWMKRHEEQRGRQRCITDFSSLAI
jgi:hypothetical protein